MRLLLCLPQRRVLQVLPPLPLSLLPSPKPPPHWSRFERDFRLPRWDRDRDRHRELTHMRVPAEHPKEAARIAWRKHTGQSPAAFEIGQHGTTDISPTDLTLSTAVCSIFMFLVLNHFSPVLLLP